MSVYYSINGEPPNFLGSNTGWADAGQWIDALDHTTYPLLVQFREHGLAEPAPQLAQQITAALAASQPDPDVVGVMQELLAGCGDAGADGVLILSDGVPQSASDTPPS